MTRNRVISSLLLATGMFLMAGCASQSASKTVSLDDKYFQREASKLQKFEHEGKTIYCQNDSRVGASLISYKQCITESGLRQLVENTRRSRNSVAYTQVRSRG